MSKESAPVYTEDDIRSLSSLEHIQARPGMYIGRLGDGEDPDDGIYVLLKEVIDNSVDEFIMGHGKSIDVGISEDGCVSVRDYGRGIPLGKLVECVSKINTGAKYSEGAFEFSVGLNGVGLKAVNALSSDFTATAFRGGKFKRASFQKGVLGEEEGGKADEPDGTAIRFTPDSSFFPEYQYDPKYVRRRLFTYAYLNTGLSLCFRGETFHSRNGLLDLLEEKVADGKSYEVIYHRGDQIEFAFCHTAASREAYFSFVNGQYTNDGGTHQSAFRQGILQGVNEFAGKTLEGDDVRNGIVGAVAIKLKSPIFESQTKNKLGNVEIRSSLVLKVKEVITAHLYKHPETADVLLKRIAHNEKLRKEITELKRKNRTNESRAALRIPKLKDCKFHLSDAPPKKGESRAHETMVFLTEGQSAAGSLISCRDVETQAIFSLKGKPLNCHGHRRETVYKNEELFFIMKALGVEDDLDALRYEKVIIATDADVDGAHIRNLLITFFLTFFEPLVLSGHLYVLETPLFRVRNKKKTVYCFDERERDRARGKLGKTAEITRFKGLGEISPKEFGQFIGDDMRIRRVNVDHQRSVEDLMKFFMGKNTPMRRGYIMRNLI
ncbi:MAG: type IIA DNA topoisomerase subunit B [Lentisphaeria bacterium]|nr:type IIA DNA topoisomerase subunit B [Lentisphaeria bacterium]